MASAASNEIMFFVNGKKVSQNTNDILRVSDFIFYFLFFDAVPLLWRLNI